MGFKLKPILFVKSGAVEASAPITARDRWHRPKACRAKVAVSTNWRSLVDGVLIQEPHTTWGLYWGY